MTLCAADGEYLENRKAFHAEQEHKIYFMLFLIHCAYIFDCFDLILGYTPNSSFVKEMGGRNIIRSLVVLLTSHLVTVP